MKSLLVFAVLLLASASATFDNDVLTENEEEVVYRVTRDTTGPRRKSVAADSECRYQKGPWDDCDTVSNTQKRTLMLKRGGQTCEQTKILTRKCKKACRYQKAEWGPCDPNTGMKTRTDSLKSQSDTTCEATRVVNKKCSSNCRYNREVYWGECDPATNQKTKVMPLLPGNPQDCEATKVVTKPCRGGRRRGGGAAGRGRGKQVPEDDYEDED